LALKAVEWFLRFLFIFCSCLNDTSFTEDT
jgi:hypothetical protein